LNHEDAPSFDLTEFQTELQDAVTEADEGFCIRHMRWLASAVHAGATPRSVAMLNLIMFSYKPEDKMKDMMASLMPLPGSQKMTYEQAQTMWSSMLKEAAAIDDLEERLESLQKVADKITKITQ